MQKKTNRLTFSSTVKEAIAKRDEIDGWPCCVYCGAPAPEYLAWSNAHYVSRGQGGRGIEENGLTLCPQCHGRFDQTSDRKEMRVFFRQYLAQKYPDFDESQRYRD